MKNPRRSGHARAPLARRVTTADRPNARATPRDYDHINIVGNLIRLNREPLEVPPETLRCYLGRDSRGRAVLLCPVNEANKVPKGFRHRVQFVMPFWEPNGEQLVLVHTNGKVYVVVDS